MASAFPILAASQSIGVHVRGGQSPTCSTNAPASSSESMESPCPPHVTPWFRLEDCVFVLVSSSALPANTETFVWRVQFLRRNPTDHSAFSVGSVVERCPITGEWALCLHRALCISTPLHCHPVSIMRSTSMLHHSRESHQTHSIQHFAQTIPSDFGFLPSSCPIPARELKQTSRWSALTSCQLNDLAPPRGDFRLEV